MSARSRIIGAMPALLTATALLIIACGPAPSAMPGIGSGDVSTDNPAATPTQVIPALSDLRYTCGSFPFGADILTGPASQDQDAPTAAAAAVRAELTSSPPETGLPKRGWRLVGSDAGHAQYVALDAAGQLVTIAVMLANGSWQLDQSGSCLARVVTAAGVGPASWTWGSAGKPGATTQRFDALVTEEACASGRKADGRIIGPVVAASATIVLVFFGVHPLAGAQDCQGNPWTRVPVDLGVSLGNRRLLDGGHLPFDDPTQPTS